MATQLQIRRGTTAQMNAFTGAEGELAVNTTTDTVHVHDGSTAGGFALAKADGSNIGTYAGSFTTISASGAITGNVTGDVTGDLTGSVLTAAQTNITSVGTLSALTVTGEITANGGIALGDNDKATFGGSDDLQIFHDGSNSIISESGTGGLRIETAGVSTSGFYKQNSTPDEAIATFEPDGPVTLYYNNAPKLATTSTGIDVTGNMIADGVGIGTSPSAPLDVVSGSGAVGQYIRGRSSDNIGSLYFTSNASASTEYGYVQGRSTDLRIQGFNNGLILQPSSGNVGIGTTSLAAKLTVGTFGDTARAAQFHGGSILVDGGAASEIIMGDGNVAYMSIQTTDDATAMKIRNYSGNSDLVTVDRASGKVGIGTSSPTQELEIKAASVPTLKLNQAGTYGAEIALRGNDLDIAGSANDIVFYTGGNNDVSTTERVRISAEGYVTTPYQPVFATTGTNYTQVSNILTKIIPNAVAFDIGNNYSNGVFTAPVAGVYEFAFWGLVYPITTSTINFTIAYFKNSAFAGTEVQSSGPNNQHSMVAGSILLNLSQYDTVHLELNTSQGGAYNGQWNMSGKLIG